MITECNGYFDTKSQRDCQDYYYNKPYKEYFEVRKIEKLHHQEITPLLNYQLIVMGIILFAFLGFFFFAPVD